MGFDPSELPPIIQTGAPVLRARALEVAPEKIPTPELQQLISTMVATMRKAPGVGLAAPQIGIPLRIIVLEDDEKLISQAAVDKRGGQDRFPFSTRVFINPALRTIGTQTETAFEGCLSVNGYTALVERSAEVEVTGLDGQGQAQVWRVRGWPARILQHEVDHINGTLYIDRMMSRSFATVGQAKEFYGDRPLSEILKLLKLDETEK